MEWLQTIDGPSFLILYFFWFVLTWSATVAARRFGFDNPLTTLLGLGGFEGLGILRIIVGSAHGMHKWGFLILMMIAGALFFLIRLKSFGGGKGGKDGAGSSGCGIFLGGSGCSSDSGGGSNCGGSSSCGGGGCGGCGGS